MPRIILQVLVLFVSILVDLSFEIKPFCAMYEYRIARKAILWENN